MKKILSKKHSIKQKAMNLLILLVLTILIGSILYQIVGPKPIGLANNADFQRVSQRSGIDYPYNPWDQKHYSDSFNRFVHFKFVYIEPMETHYISSTQLFLNISKFVDKVLFGEETYDIRSLALTYLTFLFIGILLIMLAFKDSPFYMQALVIATLCIFYTDVSFVQYFNSFYSEITTMIMSILFFALSIFYIQYKELQKNNWGKWLVYLLLVSSTILVIKSKTQDIMMILPMFLLLTLILRDILRGKKTQLAMGSMLTLGIIIAAIILTNSTKPENPRAYTKNQSMYNIVFEELLPNSPNKLNSLMALGLPVEDAKALVKQSGSNYISKDTGFDYPEAEPFFENVSFKNIALYYATRPHEFFVIAKNRSRALFINPAYSLTEIYNNRYTAFLANYKKEDALYPTQLSDSFDFWSNIKRVYFPKNIYTVIFIYIMAATLSMIAIQRSQNRLLNIHWLNITIILMGAIQFVSCIMGDSKRDDIKHFFTFNQYFDLNLLFILGYFIYIIQYIVSSSKIKKMNMEESFKINPIHIRKAN